MLTNEESIQKTIYSLEMGALVVWMRRILILAAIVGLIFFYMAHEFRGLATSQAMDQAQIGREIARGHGWSTKVIRPAAIADLRRAGKDVTRNIRLDTFNAPLPPLADALALLAVKGYWTMSPRDILYAGDVAIAILSIAMFIGSICMLYLISIELFDKQLALLACGLVLICDMMWRYSLSGLPQMLLLLLFHLTVYALIRAIKAQYLGSGVRLWLAAAGLGFGLMALSHALTIWLFPPAVIFSAFFFRQRLWAAGILLAVFLAVYSPWLARNCIVCGSPWGLAVYSTGEFQMRQLDLNNPPGAAPQPQYGSIKEQLVDQFNRIFECLGWSCVASVAFISLLHAFKRPATAVFRWLFFAMWLGAVLGMAVFGIHYEQGVAANQLHLIFMPLMTCYGLAFILVQFDRRIGLAVLVTQTSLLRATHRAARNVLLVLLFVLCGLPLIFTLLSPKPYWQVRWPPYLPPYIAVIGKWMKPGEIIGSDMPAAVAWYADRRSLDLPDTVKGFLDLGDYNVLGGPVNGLYLTPVSGSENTLGDIVEGDYKDWAPFILRTTGLRNFPLKWAINLGMKECIFYSDHDRRSPR